LLCPEFLEIPSWVMDGEATADDLKDEPPCKPADGDCKSTAIDGTWLKRDTVRITIRLLVSRIPSIHKAV